MRWHQYTIVQIPQDLKTQMLEEIQLNNLNKSNKVLLDFNYLMGNVTVSIYDHNPYNSYFVLKYGDYIHRTHTGETQ